MIEILLNGVKEKIVPCTLKEMLEKLSYEDEAFAVAINGTFVPLKSYHDRQINEGDEIEILAPMVGG